MRLNTPITQREHSVPANQMLVSVTDLKGHMVYCNPAFVAISGYAREELLGQAHNLIRHPDMPAEAFRDLWATIQSGRPWQAIVKNRRKNGDHYWVHANATPVRNGDRIVGYLSVRSAATREEVSAAESLYARMRKEAELGRIKTGLRGGRVVRRDGPARAMQEAWSQVDRWGMDGLAQLMAVLVVGASATVLPLAFWLPMAFVLAAGAWWLAWRRRDATLRTLLSDAVRVASGDLAQTPRTDAQGSHGALQMALAQIAVNLRAVVGDVRNEVENVRLSVGEIAVGNQDLSRRTESQGGALEKTTVSMEQITQRVHKSATSAAQGAELSKDSATVAQLSQDGVLAVVKAMDAISDSSRRIGSITHVIEGVAFQTNILALNAAVEAARAGPAGRGFAVVAAEVRTLAQRTASAAQEIKQLIGESSERVASGASQTQAASERMREAMESVEKVNDLLSGISLSIQEQQSDILHVNDAVTHIGDITQQNGSLVLELAAEAQSLDGQMRVVTDGMRLFRLDANDSTIAETASAEVLRKSATPTGEGGRFHALKDAVAAHMQWKTKLRMAVRHNETLDVSVVSRDDRCALGQWLHGEGQQCWGKRPAFVELVRKHAQFHEQVGAVAQLVNEDQSEAALRNIELGSDFDLGAKATVAAIHTLQHEITRTEQGAVGVRDSVTA